ncbi:MAG: PIN domain-containing protein [Chitinophagaceae bacterium]|nr:PIN domain-containing protein [Chitinophagaceae bacterium]
MSKAFIDIDVTLDFMIAREPFAMDAARIFSLSEKKQISICTTGLVFSNAYYVLGKLGSHKKVIEKLTHLARLINIIGLPKISVIQALESEFGDFEDALQHYAALSEDVKIIITRNTKYFKHSQLAILTPDQYFKSRA